MEEIVRTYRNMIELIHSRVPRDILVKFRGKNILLIGVGGVGSWTAIALALTPINYLAVIDNDELEETNANRLIYPITWFFRKKHKVDAIIDFIRAIRPHVRIAGVKRRIETIRDIEFAILQFGMGEISFVIDAVDNVVTIQLIKQFCRKYRIPYIGGHYDGTSLTIEYIIDWATSKEEWIAEDQRGYRVFPSFVAIPMMIASTIVTLIGLEPSKNIFIQFDMRDQF